MSFDAWTFCVSYDQSMVLALTRRFKHQCVRESHRFTHIMADQFHFEMQSQIENDRCIMYIPDMLFYCEMIGCENVGVACDVFQIIR